MGQFPPLLFYYHAHSCAQVTCLACQPGISSDSSVSVCGMLRHLFLHHRGMMSLSAGLNETEGWAGVRISWDMKEDMSEHLWRPFIARCNSIAFLVGLSKNTNKKNKSVYHPWIYLLEDREQPETARYTGIVGCSSSTSNRFKISTPGPEITVFFQA